MLYEIQFYFLAVFPTLCFLYTFVTLSLLVFYQYDLMQALGYSPTSELLEEQKKVRELQMACDRLLKESDSTLRSLRRLEKLL